MTYMGCVTDRSWVQAVMEQFPNRKPGHPDAGKRKKLSSEIRDLFGLAGPMLTRQNKRYYRD